MLGLPRIDAVLLDMDGTLVDSHAAVERASRAWAKAWGADAALTIAVSPGRPADQTIRQVMPHLSDQDVQRAAAEQLALQYHDLDDVTAMPGLHHLLDTLAELHLPWAVVTSADPPLAAARLGAVGVVAPIVVTCLDVSRGKPDPEPFLHAATLLRVDPSACASTRPGPSWSRCRRGGLRCWWSLGAPRRCRSPMPRTTRLWPSWSCTSWQTQWPACSRCGA